jgi:hypothetical protein
MILGVVQVTVTKKTEETRPGGVQTTLTLGNPQCGVGSGTIDLIAPLSIVFTPEQAQPAIQVGALMTFLVVTDIERPELAAVLANDSPTLCGVCGGKKTLPAKLSCRECYVELMQGVQGGDYQAGPVEPSLSEA